VSVIRDVPKVVVPPVPPVPGVVPDPPPPPPPPIVKSLTHFTPAGVVYVPVPEVNRCTVGAVAVTGFVGPNPLPPGITNGSLKVVPAVPIFILVTSSVNESDPPLLVEEYPEID
jgi:hypothetical protein